MTKRTSGPRAWAGGYPAVLVAVAILSACGRSQDLSVVLLAPYFSTARTDSGHEFQTAAALFYLNADLSLRWSKAVGLPRALGDGFVLLSDGGAIDYTELIIEDFLNNRPRPSKGPNHALSGNNTHG